MDRLDDNYKHWAYLLEHNNSRLIFDAVVHGDNFKTAVEATTFAKGDVVVRKGCVRLRMCVCVCVCVCVEGGKPGGGYLFVPSHRIRYCLPRPFFDSLPFH